MASNTKLLFFLLICISLLLVVEINIHLTALVAIGILGFTLVTMVLKSLFNLKEMRKQINTKRVIIFAVGSIVMIAYLNY